MVQQATIVPPGAGVVTITFGGREILDHGWGDTYHISATPNQGFRFDQAKITYRTEIDGVVDTITEWSGNPTFDVGEVYINDYWIYRTSVIDIEVTFKTGPVKKYDGVLRNSNNIILRNSSNEILIGADYFP